MTSGVLSAASKTFAPVKPSAFSACWGDRKKKKKEPRGRLWLRLLSSGQPVETSRPETRGDGPGLDAAAATPEGGSGCFAPCRPGGGRARRRLGCRGSAVPAGPYFL